MTKQSTALKFLEWFCPDHLYEGIAGDLEERFDADLLRVGQRRARLMLLWNVIRFFRPYIISKNKFSSTLQQPVMLGNYIKVASRTILKRKVYAFINAFGLSIGIAFSILICLFIVDERSFDQFHVNKDRIYRVDMKTFITWNSDPEKRFDIHCWLQMPVKDALKNDLKEVELATYFVDTYGSLSYKDKAFNEQVVFVTSDFFDMFSFPLLKGNAKQLFKNKNEVVITPEIARKYFGDEDPIGKTIIVDLNGNVPVTVAAIIQAPPSNSSLNFKILLPVELRSGYEQMINQWGSYNTPIFFQVRPGTKYQSLVAGLDELVKRHMGDDIKKRIENSVAVISEGTKIVEYIPTSLLSIHLNTDVWFSKVSDPKYAWILSGIATLVLLIACINYISLSLSASSSRRIEVGVRKVAGAHRRQLVYQFSLESIILALLSLILGVILAVVFLPEFNQFTSKAIVITRHSVLIVVCLGVGLAVLVGLLAGAYPAWVLSSFRPAAVLKGNLVSKLKTDFVKPLVILQFGFSAFLIISSIIMYRQMEFLLSKDLGYDKEQVVVVPLPSGGSGKYRREVDRLRHEFEKQAGIVSVTCTSNSFAQGYGRQGWKLKNGEYRSAYVYNVDQKYLSTLGIELTAGRNFDPEIASDSDAVIINEALVKAMDWKNPIDEYLNFAGDSTSLGSKVIGVTQDFNFQTLEEGVEPMFMRFSPNYRNILVKIRKGANEQTLNLIKSTWSSVFPSKPFDYSFLDQDVARQYESHKQWMSIMKFSTGFAIVISCMGLFGLSGMNALNKTKEIGIRKVMGAAVFDMFIMLNKQFIVLAMLAFLLAIPFSIYATNLWLAKFEYAITPGWEIFVLTMAIALVVSLVTVSYHGIRASLINPADTLKHE